MTLVTRVRVAVRLAPRRPHQRAAELLEPVLVKVPGAEIPDALEKVVAYMEAKRGGTLRRYDLPGQSV